jgi:hypothetical protein
MAGQFPHMHAQWGSIELVNIYVTDPKKFDFYQSDPEDFTSAAESTSRGDLSV